jgi:hypothetical protein
MYTIFAPLDANEPLPRELVMEARRHRTLGRRELAGALWLPALIAVSFIADWGKVSGTVGLGMIGIVMLGLVVFAISGEHGRR